MGKVKSLFLLGYYGFGNWGDELSLLATLQVLEDFKRMYGFPLICRILSGSPHLPFPLPPDCRIVLRRAPGAVFSALWESPVLLVGGGSLLQDVTSFRSLLYYGAFLFLAKVLGKERVFFGCGLGPFRRTLSEWMVRFLLRGSSAFLARDGDTASFITRFALCPVTLSADPVFLLWNGETAQPSGKVALFLRKHALERHDVLCEAFTALKREGMLLECVAFHRDEDWDVASFFGERLGIPVRWFQSVGDILAYFQTLGGVLSMRFHPLVLATCFGVPWYAFDLDPKIRAFSAHWDGRNLLDFSSVTIRDLCLSLKHLEALREDTLRLREHFLRQAEEGKRVLFQVLSRILEAR